MFRYITIIYILLLAGKVAFSQDIAAGNTFSAEKPAISFTFDDGSTGDMPGLSLEEWNGMILKTLKKHNLKAVFFAVGSRLQGEKGDYVLNSWSREGHRIANHTYSHKYFNSDKITLEQYEQDLLRNDSIISKYPNYYRFFRFPYLKEGNNDAKINGFRNFLNSKGYRNGYVTIDASDWYIDSRLVKRLKNDPKADFRGFQDYYIEHLYGRAEFYDSLATNLTGRKIRHTLLLHHNLAAAIFLDSLINYFEEKGWNVIDAEEAYKDEIFNRVPKIIPAGESLIWALAKESGKFEDILRYPGEDGEYEKEAMDKKGL